MIVNQTNKSLLAPVGRRTTGNYKIEALFICGPLGPAHLGPGPVWAQGLFWPRARLGPGFVWALDPFGPGPVQATGPRAHSVSFLILAVLGGFLGGPL